MAEYLTLILAGPFASFGGPGGHERKATAELPRRSAIIGMLGAALGICRGDREGQRDLAEYEVAVQSLRTSSALRDFHTVETIPTGTEAGASTRVEALGNARGRTNTVVTLRDYRSDVAIAVAAWGGTRWSLEELAAALRCPVYTLCLGRRNCPPAWPLGPRIVDARDPVAALALVQPAVPVDRPGGWRAGDRGEVMSWTRIPGLDVIGSIEMHSWPGGRRDWSFFPEKAWIYANGSEGRKSRSCT